MMEPDGTVVDKGASAARGETPPTRDAIPLPFIHRSVQYQWMLEFTDSIPPEGDLGNLRNRLYHVTDGEGAFSRFLQELQHYPAEAARWRRYRAQNIRSRIEDWIQTYQLDATPPWQVPSEGFDLSEASDEEIIAQVQLRKLPIYQENYDAGFEKGYEKGLQDGRDGPSTQLEGAVTP